MIDTHSHLFDEAFNLDLKECIDRCYNENVNKVMKQAGIDIGKALTGEGGAADEIDKFKKLETKRIPEDINYDEIKSLRIEAVQKLKQYRPISIGQASRISGVSPADISVLLVYLEQQRRQKEVYHESDF